MLTSIKHEDLVTLVISQLNIFFPDASTISADMIRTSSRTALERLEYCSKHINNKYYRRENQTLFNHLHADQYAMFLYFLSRELFDRTGQSSLCDKVYYLNKVLNGCDIFYEIDLPSIFMLVHPLGTVLGRAKYSDYLVVYQGVRVGSNHGKFPEISEFATLRPGSSIIGDCQVGRNVQFGVNALIIDTDVEKNTTVLGQKPNNVYKPNEIKYELWDK